MDQECTELFTSVRSQLRRLEDDAHDLSRKKADLADVEVMARKQSESESEVRARLQSIGAGMDELRSIMGRMADSMRVLSDEHATHKKKVSSELEELAPKVIARRSAEDNRPMIAGRLQLFVVLLAGIGLMFVISEAPQMLRAFAAPSLVLP